MPFKNLPQRRSYIKSDAPLVRSALVCSGRVLRGEREGNTETVVHSCYSYISPVILCGFGIRRRRRKSCCLISLSELPRVPPSVRSQASSVSAFDDVDVVAPLSRLQFRESRDDDDVTFQMGSAIKCGKDIQFRRSRRVVAGSLGELNSKTAASLSDQTPDIYLNCLAASNKPLLSLRSCSQSLAHCPMNYYRPAHRSDQSVSLRCSTKKLIGAF